MGGVLEVLDDSALKRFEGEISGRVIRPEDADYDESRAVWNASIDRKPALIAYCHTTEDVAAAVRFGREQDLLTSIRAGAHNVAGNAVNDGGLVIDVRGMTQVSVDPGSRRVVCQSGLVWGELDAATQEHGLAIPGGLVSSTGVAGFTLGGGFGWISRGFGLACDKLISVEVVTADGETITASDSEHEDLFWGLRGGGGNFGVATKFEFAADPFGPELTAGLMMFPYSKAREVISAWVEFMSGAPDEVMLAVVLRLAPAAPFLPEEVHGTPVVGIAGCYAGPPEEGLAALEPITSLEGALVNLIEPRQYVQFQSMLDPSWTAGFHNYWKAEYLTGVPDEAIGTLIDHLDTITSPLSDFKIPALGGAIERVPSDATAYAFRDAPFVLNINSRWADPGTSEKHVAWTKHLWESMTPYSAGGVYVNFMGEEGQDRVRAAYGEATYDRLAGIKAKYDPTNFFRMNQNIPPAEK